jgi:ribosome-associated protein
MKKRIIVPRRETLKTARRAIRVGQEKLAKDFVLIDLHGLSNIADLFLIMSGMNERQIKVIAFEIAKTLKEEFSLHPIRIEGLTENRWVVMDYGDLIIHVFHEKVRPIYQLEELWAEGKQIEVG